MEKKYMPFTDPDIKIMKQMKSNILKMSYKGLQKDMSEAQFTEALEYVNEELNLPVSPRTLEIILASDGYAYANIIEFDFGDTEALHSINDAIANFYMNRQWPLNRDKGFPGVDEFEDRLLEEVIKRERDS